MHSNMLIRNSNADQVCLLKVIFLFVPGPLTNISVTHLLECTDSKCLLSLLKKIFLDLEV